MEIIGAIVIWIILSFIVVGIYVTISRMLYSTRCPDCGIYLSDPRHEERHRQLKKAEWALNDVLQRVRRRDK